MQEVPDARLEPGVLPAVAVDADTGVKLGLFVQLAAYRDGLSPYAWRLRAQAALSILQRDGSVRYPLQDHFLRLDLPHRPLKDGRIQLDLTYNRLANAGYYGIGNVRYQAPPGGSDAHYHELITRALTARITVQHPLGTRTLRGFVEAGALWLNTDLYEQSLLELERERGIAPRGTGAYLQASGQLGILLDRRDHEVLPTRGQFHDLSVRVGTTLSGESLSFWGADLTLRFFVPIVAPYLVFAARGVADALGGKIPLYELGRHGGLLPSPSIAGVNGVRGVPSGRFRGQTKALTNIELRAMFHRFAVGTQRFELGLTGFFDAGSVWSGWFQDSSTDPAPSRFAWGAGGGPRVRWGDSLLIRIDAAYARELVRVRGEPVALYITLDHLF